MTKKQTAAKNELINRSSNIHINYSSSFVAFLRKHSDSNKIARLLYNNYYCDNPIAYRFMFTTSEVDYITFRKDGTISYLPAGKEHKLSDDGSWLRDGRQNGKPAKVIRKLFTTNALTLLNDSDFESFTNKYKSAFGEDYKIEILPANKIASIYCTHSSNRMSGDASLNSSCMNLDYDDDRDEYSFADTFDIYESCKQLSIVVLYNKEGKLGGRALLWELKDSNGNDIKLMDRIYVAQDHQYDSFIEYAKDNGFWYKKNYKQMQDKTWFIKPNGESVYESFVVYTETDHSVYPYLDTFRYGGDGWLSNSDEKDYRYEYDNTDGRRSGDRNSGRYTNTNDDDDDDNDGMIYDDIDEGYIDEDRAVTITGGSSRGQITHIDNTIYVNGRYYYKEDDEIVYVSWNDQHYHQDDVVYSELDGCDYPLDECIETHDNEWILRDESVKTEDGEVYHEDDDDIINIEGFGWYRKDDDSLIQYEGDYYHQDDDNVVCTIDGKYIHIRQAVLIKDEWYNKDGGEVVYVNGEPTLNSYSNTDTSWLKDVNNPNQLSFTFEPSNDDGIYSSDFSLAVYRAITMPVHSVPQAIEFIRTCIDDLDLKTGFHPDNDFEDYVNYGVKPPYNKTFTSNDAKKLNSQLDSARQLIWEGDNCIYTISIDIWKELGLWVLDSVA